MLTVCAVHVSYIHAGDLLVERLKRAEARLSATDLELDRLMKTSEGGIKLYQLSADNYKAQTLCFQLRT